MKPKKLCDLLQNTMRDNPRGSEKEIHDLCLKATATDPLLHLALFEYWFANSYRDFIIAEFDSHSVAVLPASRGSRQPSTKADRERATETLKHQLKICLLDHLLSDGTPIRDATFGQCARDGGWLATIAKHGKANEIVGKKLTEVDLQNLLRRFTATRAMARAA